MRFFQLAKSERHDRFTSFKYFGSLKTWKTDQFWVVFHIDCFALLFAHFTSWYCSFTKTSGVSPVCWIGVRNRRSLYEQFSTLRMGNSFDVCKSFNSALSKEAVRYEIIIFPFSWIPPKVFSTLETSFERNWIFLKLSSETRQTETSRNTVHLMSINSSVGQFFVIKKPGTAQVGPPIKVHKNKVFYHAKRHYCENFIKWWNLECREIPGYTPIRLKTAFFLTGNIAKLDFCENNSGLFTDRTHLDPVFRRKDAQCQKIR